jgi:L-ornithine N5-oxygenase
MSENGAGRVLRERRHSEDSHSVLDTIGVGFGPSNIALAVAHREGGITHSLQFLEANPGPSWQAGMRIEGADIQHNPLRDFVTPRNPCSPYGYLSYLKVHDRLFHFLNLDARFPPRSDYEEYVRWVAAAFADQVDYEEPVLAIVLAEELDPVSGRRLIEVETPVRTLRARSLSFAPGRSRHVPPVFEPLLGDRVVHFMDYVPCRDRWKRDGGAPASIAVVGASQSAVEILLDLRSQLPGTTLHSVFRTFGFVLKDTSPFTEDLLFPSFTEYFYAAPPVSKRRLTQQIVRSNYGSVDHDVLSQLYLVLYENAVRGDTSFSIRNNTEIIAASLTAQGVALHLEDIHTGQELKLEVDAVILATGFRNTGTSENEEPFHPLLGDVLDHFERDDDGTLLVTRSYQLIPHEDRPGAPPIFLNGLCESSHGLGDAGSFSLLSYRAEEIEQALAAALAPVSSPTAAVVPGEPAAQEA